MSNDGKADLELVARHGSNRVTRCLATVQLARQQDRLGELKQFLEDSSRPRSGSVDPEQSQEGITQ